MGLGGEKNTHFPSFVTNNKRCKRSRRAKLIPLKSFTSRKSVDSVGLGCETVCRAHKRPLR